MNRTRDVLAETPPQKIKSGRIRIGLPENKATYQPMRLSDILAKGEKSGLMYFDLQAAETNDPDTKAPVYRRALVQVTNIGLTAKFGPGRHPCLDHQPPDRSAVAESESRNPQYRK